MATVNNPLAGILDQARELAANIPQFTVNIDYETLAKAVIKVFRDEQKKFQDNPHILLIQSEAHRMYHQSVIRALVRRGLLQPYKFDLKEYYDLDGNLITKTKGVVYYRAVDIEKAIEEGNVLKGTRQLRMKRS